MLVLIGLSAFEAEVSDRHYRSSHEDPMVLVWLEFSDPDYPVVILEKELVVLL